MHPILFKIGNFPVATYGVMIVIGLLAGIALAVTLGRRRGVDKNFFYDLAFVGMFSGFVGARLFSVALGMRDYLDVPGHSLFTGDAMSYMGAMLLSRTGFVFMGGFIVSMITGLWFIRRRGMPILEVGDMIAPAVALGHAFGRIGCFFAGCCHGFACGDPNAPHWAEKLCVQYPLISGPDGQPSEMFNFAYQTQIHQGLLGRGAAAPLPIFPVQLLESAGNFTIALTLFFLWKRRKFSGQIFAAYLCAYAVLRFILEYFRGDVERGLWLGGLFSTSQILCLGSFMVGLILLYSRRRAGVAPIPEMAASSVGEAAAGEPAPKNKSKKKKER